MARRTLGLRRAFDLIAPCTLGAAAYLARRGSLPDDGLWFDDSWVAAGVIHGRLSDLMTVGTGHPAFTGLLMGVYRLGSGRVSELGVPSLVAGVVGPVLLYAALRIVGYERSVSVLISAALVVAPIPILYAGRVKGYTLDTVLVLLLAIAVPRLAARTWGWSLALGWTVGALVVGAFSGFALVATALAGLVLVLHPSSDRTKRLAAVAAQGMVQGLYYLVAQTKADLRGIEASMERLYDGHMTFSWNPIRLSGELLSHLRRVAEVFPAGSGGWLTAFGVLALVGLVVAAMKGTRRSEIIAARYLLLLVVFAMVGAFFAKFPFGPTSGTGVSAGGRHTLWLVPAMAFGLAAVAHRVRAPVAKFDPLRIGFDITAIGAAVVIVMAGYQPAPAAPFPGSASATSYLDASIGPRDVIIVTTTSTFSFAVSTNVPVTLVSTPGHQIGFAPLFPDSRIHVVGPFAATRATPAEIRSWVLDAERVFVHITGALLGPGPVETEKVLTALGFTMQSRHFDWTTIQVWTR